jgi:hypothetical protein
MSNACCNYRRSYLLAAGMLFLAGPLAVQIQTSPLTGQNGTAIIIVQTSSGGSDTHLIDPASNRVIGIIEGLGLPHLHNAPGRTRTCDLRIRSPLLYPAELRAPQARALGPSDPGKPNRRGATAQCSRA